MSGSTSNFGTYNKANSIPSDFFKIEMLQTDFYSELYDYKMFYAV